MDVRFVSADRQSVTEEFKASRMADQATQDTALRTRIVATSSFGLSHHEHVMTGTVPGSILGELQPHLVRDHLEGVA